MQNHPGNIQASFEKTGIYPFNSDIFTDLDFASSYMTDRPNANETNGEDDNNLSANPNKVG